MFRSWTWRTGWPVYAAGAAVLIGLVAWLNVYSDTLRLLVYLLVILAFFGIVLRATALLFELTAKGDGSS